MNYIFLLIGTLGAIFTILMMFKGAEYEYMLESLDEDDFPLKQVYVIGLGMQGVGLFSLKGKIGDKLRTEASLLYTKQYSEFYARIVWAQILSFPVLVIPICFLLATIFSGDMVLFFAVIGVVVAGVCSYYFGTSMQEKVAERREACDMEFPNAISKLALIVNAGVILHDAWEIVAQGKDGVFYDLMKNACIEMQNGKADIDAIYEFGVLTNSEDVKKFTSALIQSIERGGGDLPQFLANQSSELWASNRQLMLQKGEKAAGALLMPIILMFAGVMLIVLSAALQSFTV